MTTLKQDIAAIIGKFGYEAAQWGADRETNPKPTDPTKEIVADIVANLPTEQSVTAKYGYNSSDKMHGYRLAINDVKELLA